MTTTKENLDMINEMGTSGYDKLRELTELNLSTWNRVLDTQLNTYSMLMENAIEQTKAVTESKNYQEAIRTQLDMGRKVGVAMIGKTREASELSQQVGSEYRAWFENNLAATKDQFNKMAEKAA